MAGDAGRQSNKTTELPDAYQESFLDNLDGRFKRAKVLKARLSLLMDDLGGINSLSYQKRSLCKRAIFLESVISDWERDLAVGNEVDLGKHTQALNSLLGLFRQLGLDRRAKDIQSLQEYLVAKEQAVDDS